MHKYLLLDYGGVVADHYCEPFTSMLGELLGVSRIKTQELISERSELGKAYRLNKIGLEEFWDGVREQVPNKGFDPQHAQELWARSYIVNEAVLSFLGYVRASYGTQVALLMNEDKDRFEYVHRQRDWSNYVDFFLSSHETGLLKPQKEVYELAAIRWGVDPSEILYIDDRDGHVEAAKAVGMEGHVFKNYGELWRTLLKGQDISQYVPNEPNLGSLADNVIERKRYIDLPAG